MFFLPQHVEHPFVDVLTPPVLQVEEQHAAAHVDVVAAVEFVLMPLQFDAFGVRDGARHHSLAHVHLLQFFDRPRYDGVGINIEQSLHVVGHHLVDKGLDAGRHAPLPCGIVGELALHLVGHGLAVQVGDTLAVPGGYLVESLLVKRMDAVVDEEHLLRLIARIVVEETQHRDASLAGIEVIDGITDV